ncbi:MAG: DUF86 domain-containing protein [Nanoarchaeota archaeon]|nr:DUF86 domain-containing protein [Nanoarchaeota archaeon]
MELRFKTIALRILKHIKTSRELVRENLDDKKIFDALSMNCFQTVNSLIDLAELIVSKKLLGFPANYSELFELLHKGKIITKDELKAFKKLIKYRNLIAHEYYQITKKEIYNMVSLFTHIERLLKKASKLIK